MHELYSALNNQAISRLWSSSSCPMREEKHLRNSKIETPPDLFLILRIYNSPQQRGELQQHLRHEAKTIEKACISHDAFMVINC